jgi:alpha,alpha-trehalose phosphorylase
MSDQPVFTIEEWSVREKELHFDSLAQTESVFALSNGHIGLRGNLDEGDPHGLPGTYLNSFCELRPLPYAEGGYAYPESGQTIINVTDSKLIRLLVDDEPFDVRYGHVDEHERELDLRDGVLRRNVLWTTPAGRKVKVSSTRLVSFTQRAIVAINYEVEALETPIRIVVQSELVANEALPPQSKDPRVGAALESPLESEEHQAQDASGLLIHHTKASGLRMGAAMHHIIEGPEMLVESGSFPDVVRVSIAGQLKPGERLRITKFISYGWSSVRSRPAIHDQIVAALTAAQITGWDGLLADQRAYLDKFWANADIELDGDPEIQQAVRFAAMGRPSARAPACRTWKRAKRTACWISGSPSSSMSAFAQNLSR